MSAKALSKHCFPENKLLNGSKWTLEIEVLKYTYIYIYICIYIYTYAEIAPSLTLVPPRNDEATWASCVAQERWDTQHTQRGLNAFAKVNVICEN